MIQTGKTKLTTKHFDDELLNSNISYITNIFNIDNDSTNDKENLNYNKKSFSVSSDIETSSEMSKIALNQKYKNKLLDETARDDVSSIVAHETSNKPPSKASSSINSLKSAARNDPPALIEAVSPLTGTTAVTAKKDTTTSVNTNPDQTMKILIIGNAKCGKSSIIKRYVNQAFNGSYKTTVGADYQRKDLRVHVNRGNYNNTNSDNKFDNHTATTIHVENPTSQKPAASTLSCSTSSNNIVSLSSKEKDETINNNTNLTPATSSSLEGLESVMEYRNVRLQLWDIAGQDRFHKLTRVYFKNAVGVIIVCDVSRERTVEAIKGWKAEIDDWIENSANSNTDGSDKQPQQKIPIVLFANKSDLLLTIDDAFAAGAAIEKVCHELGFLNWWSTSAMSGAGVNEGFDALVKNIIQLEITSNSNINSKNKSTVATNISSSSSTTTSRGFKLTSFKQPIMINKQRKQQSKSLHNDDDLKDENSDDDDEWEFTNNSFDNNYSLCCA